MNKRKRHAEAAPPPPAPSRWWPEALGMLVASVLTGVCLHFSVVPLSDHDALYHLRQAWVYRTYGLGYGEFPWVTASVVGQYGGDLWYGFHVLLLPFAGLADPLLGVRLAGVVVTALGIMLLWWALRLWRVPVAWLWPWLMVLGAPVSAGRVGTLRPHVLSNGLALLALPVLAGGVWWQIFLIGLAFGFVHYNLSWVLVLVPGVWLAVTSLTTQRLAWRQFLLLLAGLLAGGLLRPNLLGTARLFVIQTWGKLVAIRQGVSFGVSGESARLDALHLQANFIPTAAVLVLGIGLGLGLAVRRGWRVSEPQRVAIWTCLAISLAFFGVALALAMRAADQWQIFGFAALALMGGAVQEQPEVRAFLVRRRGLRRWGLGLAILGVALLAAHSVTWSLAATKYSMPKPTRLRPVCAYLDLTSPLGAIVYTPRWDVFGELFFWNTHNRYINGMDPIFEYAYSPDLYWKSTHLVEGGGSTTCGLRECTPSSSEDTFTVLRRDFHADYLLLQRRAYPALCAYASGDPRFTLSYDDPQWMLFQLTGKVGKGSP
jgi:hypothetical protein